MKEHTLTGLNPLNPAAFLVAIGALAAVSRYRDGKQGWNGATLHWPEPVGMKASLPLRPILTLPTSETELEEALLQVCAVSSPRWPEAGESGLEDITEGGSGLLKDQFRRAREAGNQPLAAEFGNDARRVVVILVDPSPKKDAERKKLERNQLEFDVTLARLPEKLPQKAKETESLLAKLSSSQISGKALYVAVKGKPAAEKLRGFEKYPLTIIEPCGTGPHFYDLSSQAKSVSAAAQLAWLSNGCWNRKLNAEPTMWQFGMKAGLLRPLRDAAEFFCDNTFDAEVPTRKLSKTEAQAREKRRVAIQQLLFGRAWLYDTTGPMLGLDSDTQTDGARTPRTTDGASPPQCLTALRFIGEALSLFTVGANGRVGPISRQAMESALPDLARTEQKTEAFLYPLWSTPLTINELILLLNYPWHRLLGCRRQLQSLGIWGLLLAPSQLKGSMGDPTERQLGRAIRVL